MALGNRKPAARAKHFFALLSCVCVCTRGSTTFCRNERKTSGLRGRERGLIYKKFQKTVREREIKHHCVRVPTHRLRVGVCVVLLLVGIAAAQHFSHLSAVFWDLVFLIILLGFP